MKLYLLIFTIIILSFELQAQDLYQENKVITIEIRFSQPDYWKKLNDNYAQEINIPATLIVNGSETFDSVGVRFKGNSSYNLNTEKKSFNISIDEYRDGQKLWGYKTLNLNNSFVDPTFCREKLGNDIFRNYLPACSVSYVRLYINGQYWGLYTNVEQINKDFFSKWFVSDIGNSYKGDPRGSLAWRGASVELYKKDYEKKTNEEYDNWSDLVELINVINNSSNLEVELPKVLNVDRALWYFALCNIFVNLDSYINSGHNYYIYNNPSTNRFNIIAWDMNEIFGCFPPQLANKIEFPVINTTGPNIPVLLTKVLQNPSFKAAYLAHYRTILKEVFHPDTLLPRINYLQNLIDTYVQNDTKKLYSYPQFKDNINNDVNAQGRTVPGLISFVNKRRTFLLNDENIKKGTPEIRSVKCIPAVPRAGENAAFTAEVSDQSGIAQVSFNYMFSDTLFSKLQMFDDGKHDDGAANDRIYGCTIKIPDGFIGQRIKYYIHAKNNQGEVKFEPERAENICYEAIITGIQIASGSIVINEIMADNKASIADEKDEYDDWFELYNTTGNQVDLSGCYLSDDIANPLKWKIPTNTIIAPKGFLLFWADDDAADGPLHASFKLSKSGEQLVLTSSDGKTLIDSITFVEQQTDISYGRDGDGNRNWVYFNVPTPNASNIRLSVEDDYYENIFTLRQNYPNPFERSTTISYELYDAAFVVLKIYNSLGNEITSLSKGVQEKGNYSINFNAENLPEGIYYYRLQVGNKSIIRKMMLSNE